MIKIALFIVSRLSKVHPGQARPLQPLARQVQRGGRSSDPRDQHLRQMGGHLSKADLRILAQLWPTSVAGKDNAILWKRVKRKTQNANAICETAESAFIK